MNTFDLEIGDEAPATPHAPVRPIVCKGLALFVVAMLLCAVPFVLIGCSIAALIQISEQEQQSKCPNSHMWFYVIVRVLVIGLAACFVREEKDTTILARICACGYVAWGIYELFGVSCVSELRHTLLYTMLSIYVWLDMIGTCIDAIAILLNRYCGYTINY